MADLHCHYHSKSRLRRVEPTHHSMDYSLVSDGIRSVAKLLRPHLDATKVTDGRLNNLFSKLTIQSILIQERT